MHSYPHFINYRLTWLTYFPIFWFLLYFFLRSVLALLLQGGKCSCYSWFIFPLQTIRFWGIIAQWYYSCKWNTTCCVWSNKAQNKVYRSFIRTQIRCTGKVFEGFRIGQKSQILLSLIHNFTAGKVKWLGGAGPYLEPDQDSPSHPVSLTSILTTTSRWLLYAWPALALENSCPHCICVFHYESHNKGALP